MLINKERFLVFCLSPKAASRWFEKVFIRRGFRPIGNRHEGPRNLTTALGLPIETEWWDSDPMDYDYAFAVRNHGDALRSWWTTFRETVPHANQEKVCPAFLREWPRQYPRLFLGSRRLWRFVWDLPGASVLRFESLVKDTNRYLEAYDLGGLQDWEMARDPKHETPNKSPRPWREDYTPEGLEYIRKIYRAEAGQLGYRF
jgi:hypothetical protein